MRRTIEPIVMDVHLPAGFAGPEPLDFDVRCYLISHASGFVLVDTGMAGGGDPIRAALERVGAGWADITDIVLTHGHADHVGGLAEVAANTGRAPIWAAPEERASIPAGVELTPLVDGGIVRDLRVLRTPGHTPGHTSLVLDEESILLAGDLVGSMAGSLSRGPAQFTADAPQAERSLVHISDLQFDRVLFGHGSEVPDPMGALRTLVSPPDRAAP